MDRSRRSGRRQCKAIVRRSFGDLSYLAPMAFRICFFKYRPLDGHRIPRRPLTPLDQPKTRTVFESDLDPGDTERMNAGTGVVIAFVGLMVDLDAKGLDLGLQVALLRQRKVLEDRPVGVAGDDGGDALVVMVCPFMEALVHLVAQAGIEGGAGRVLYAAPLQVRPEVVHEELAHGRNLPAALRVRLVSVDEQDGADCHCTPAATLSSTLAVAYPGLLPLALACSTFPCLGNRQDDPLVDLDTREQRAIDSRVVLPVEVMIPPYLEVPGLLRIRIVEFRQELIDRRVGDVDLIKIIVLPKLLGIAQFDVGETVFKVVSQGAAVDQGVLSKVIGP